MRRVACLFACGAGTPIANASDGLLGTHTLKEGATLMQDKDFIPTNANLTVSDEGGDVMRLQTDLRKFGSR